MMEIGIQLSKNPNNCSHENAPNSRSAPFQCKMVVAGLSATELQPSQRAGTMRRCGRGNRVDSAARAGAWSAHASGAGSAPAAKATDPASRHPTVAPPVGQPHRQANVCRAPSARSPSRSTTPGRRPVQKNVKIRVFKVLVQFRTSHLLVAISTHPEETLRHAVHWKQPNHMLRILSVCKHVQDIHTAAPNIADVWVGQQNLWK